MVFLNKKGDGVVAVIIIVVVVILLGFLINFRQRECNSNSDCGEDYYCDVEHNCNEIPVIEKDVIIQQNYVWPSIIIALAIIVVLLVPKYLKFRKETKTEEFKDTKDYKIDENKSTSKEDEKIQAKKSFSSYHYHDPIYSQEYTIKTRENNKKFLFNNYVGIIIGGLVGIGLVLATNIDYFLFAFLGAIFLFVVVYKLWRYCIEFNAELYLITILSFIYVSFSFIYFSKGGLFVLIGLGFLAITFFLVKETLSWISYKNS